MFDAHPGLATTHRSHPRRSLLLILTTLWLCTTLACGDDDENTLDAMQDDVDMGEVTSRDMGPGVLPSDMSTTSEPDMGSTTVEPDMSTPEDMETPRPSGPVDPNCVDGKYTESLPVLADISAQMGSYSPANTRGFYEAVLDARYPMGAKVVREADRSSFDCVEAFKGFAQTADQALDSLGTVVHECGHFYDLDRGSFEGSHYALTPTLSFQCSRGDTTSRGGLTFERSRINSDQFAPMRPYCNQGANCDFYASVYLDGDPDDASFEGGDQGYNSVLEETTQYINSLATAYAFRDTYTTTKSERDGILTFLWYIGRYLHMARTQYPSAYQHISQDPCWRQATLTLWGRAWLFLEATRDEPRLGIDDDAIELLVLDPLILEEIQRLRDLEGCSL